MQSTTRAYLYTALTILGWGGAASAFEIALRQISPLQLLLFSVIISLVILLGLLIFNGKLQTLATISFRHWVYLLGLGILNPFLYYLILFEAYHLLPGQVAMSLNYLWPMMLEATTVCRPIR